MSKQKNPSGEGKMQQVAGYLADLHMKAASVNPNVSIVPQVTKGEITGFSLRHTDAETNSISDTKFTVHPAFEKDQLSALWIRKAGVEQPLILDVPEHAKAFYKFVDLQGSEPAEPSAGMKSINAPVPPRRDFTDEERAAAYKKWTAPGARKP